MNTKGAPINRKGKMRRPILGIISILLLCFVGLGFACKPKTPDGTTPAPETVTTMRKIANISDDIANSIDKGRRVINELRRKNLITAAEANNVRRELINVSNITDAYTEVAAKHQTYDADAKAEAQKWVTDVKEANQRLVDNGAYHISNPQSRTVFSGAIGGISNLVQSLIVLIAELKVEPKTS